MKVDESLPPAPWWCTFNAMWELAWWRVFHFFWLAIEVWCCGLLRVLRLSVACPDVVGVSPALVCAGVRWWTNPEL
jgi:hypothetical protein